MLASFVDCAYVLIKWLIKYLHAEKSYPITAPKVTKRKALTIGSQDTDISIQRPVVKSANVKGMIPPPPSVVSSTEASTMTSSTSIPATMNLKSECVIGLSPVTSVNVKSTATTIAVNPILPEKGATSDRNITVATSLCEIPSGSSEKLVTNESLKPAASPQCLRPHRKIEDVTTVKRQPKTGWL